MSKRPAATLIFVATNKLVRADQRPGVALEVREFPRADVEDLAVLVDFALRQGPPGRAVWVLSVDLFSQTVTLPAAASMGLEGAQLADALKYEVEALSGLGALESVLGFVALPGEGLERGYWVTQALASQVASVDDVVRRLGGRLRGICHPGALPYPVGGEGGGGPWARLEQWPGTTLEVRSEAGAPGGVRVTYDPDPDGPWGGSNGAGENLFRHPEDGERGLGPLEAAGEANGGARGLPGGVYRELLLAGGVDTAPNAGWDERVRTLRLEASDALQSWLALWARHLTASPAVAASAAQVPQIGPPRRPLSREARLTSSLGLALATLLLCVGHHTWLGGQVAALDGELKGRPDPAREARQVQQEVQRLTGEEEALRARVGELEQVQARYGQALALQRRRHARLLTILARVPGELVVESITDRGQEVVLRGRARHAHLPGELASLLAAELGGLGWRVAAPSAAALQHHHDGGPWTFELSLRDADLPASPGGASGAGASRRESAR